MQREPVNEGGSGDQRVGEAQPVLAPHTSRLVGNSAVDGKLVHRPQQAPYRHVVSLLVPFAATGEELRSRHDGVPTIGGPSRKPAHLFEVIDADVGVDEKVSQSHGPTHRGTEP